MRAKIEKIGIPEAQCRLVEQDWSKGAGRVESKLSMGFSVFGDASGRMLKPTEKRILKLVRQANDIMNQNLLDRYRCMIPFETENFSKTTPKPEVRSPNLHVLK